jgi:hypothetical protein
MAEEVASLQTHVLPLLEEIQPTWYEEASCDILEYPRGTFSDDGECGGRPAEQPFDDVAGADLDRLLDAVERSGVPTDELMSATYAQTAPSSLPGSYAPAAGSSGTSRTCTPPTNSHASGRARWGPSPSPRSVTQAGGSRSRRTTEPRP